MSFEALGLSAPLVRAVANKGYVTPTPVQTQAIPPVIAGRDLLGCSQTGTGKTAAFALPILHRLAAANQSDRPSNERPAADRDQRSEPRYERRTRKIRAIILSPTRELAAQTSDCFLRYGQGCGLRTTVIFGGVNQSRQTRDLQRGVDIVVATPGRFLDLYEQGYIDLSAVQIVVLDEADHMLDMGFLPDVKRIMAKVPRDRQTLLFSATMPPAIRELTEQILDNPVQISIAPETPAGERVEQGMYLVRKVDKPNLLAHLLESRPAGSTLVFSRTKHGADKIVDKLYRQGISAEAIHGNKSQSNRQRVLEGFRSGRIQVLVATDIAARGIDVRGIQYVINFDCPETPETYVHRIGRTGRAGESGNAVTFCSGEERSLMVAVERHLRTRLAILRDVPDTVAFEEEPNRDDRRTPRPQNRRFRAEGRGRDSRREAIAAMLPSGDFAPSEGRAPGRSRPAGGSRFGRSGGGKFSAKPKSRSRRRPNGVR